MSRAIVVASFVTRNEKYGAWIFGPFGAFDVSGSSLGLMAHAIEETLANSYGVHDPAAVENVWLGRLIDTSRAHVEALIAECSDPRSMPA